MKAKNAGLAVLTALLAGCSHIPFFGHDDAKTEGPKTVPATPVVDYGYQGAISYVRLEPREAGSPLNEHPVVAYTGDMVRERLGRIELPAQGNAPLLGPAELSEISTPIARALGYATPYQDVCFAVASPAVAGAAQTITTGRVFRVDGHLNVIVGLVHQPFTAQMAASHQFPTGHRAAASADVALATDTDAAVVTRPDWITFQNLSPAVAGARPGAPAAAAGTAPAPAAAAAAPAAPPPSTAVAPAPSAPTPGYDAVADRLRTLRKLLDDGLITQQEYDEKRRQIIGGL
jgi:hypothetical protein